MLKFKKQSRQNFSKLSGFRLLRQLEVLKPHKLNSLSTAADEAGEFKLSKLCISSGHLEKLELCAQYEIQSTVLVCFGTPLLRTCQEAPSNHSIQVFCY